MTEGFLHASITEESNKGYTEYGYRGLEELKQKDKTIQKLQEQIHELQIQL